MDFHPLLAIDSGLYCGFAFFNPDGTLDWYRSRHIPDRSRLKTAARSILTDCPPETHVILEGGGDLAEIWRHMCERLNIPFHSLAAETWRQDLLIPRQRRTGRDAKRTAGVLARRVIEWSGAKRPTSLRHDVAEAILIGLWWMLKTGAITQRPDDIFG